jgi:hypothetical protein
MSEMQRRKSRRGRCRLLDKVPQWMAYKQTFLTVWRLEIQGRGLACLVLVRACFWFADNQPFAIPSHGRKRVRGSFWGPSYQGTNPIHEASSNGRIRKCQALSPIITTLGVRI